MKILLDVHHNYSEVRDETYWFIYIEFIAVPEGRNNLLDKVQWYTIGSTSPTPEEEKTFDDCLNNFLDILERYENARKITKEAK